MSETIADVVIVGGGAIGLASALALLEAGRSVRLLEKGRVGGATSHGNCGTLTPSHAPPLASITTLGKALRWTFTPDAPLYLPPRWDPALWRWLAAFTARCNARDWQASAQARARLLLASRQLIGAWVEARGLDCEFAAEGLLEVYRDPRALARDAAELPTLAEFGIASNVLDARQLAAAEPALKPGLAGAIQFPGDAHLRPDRYCAELARCVRAAGGVIEEGVEVDGFSASGDVIDALQTSAGPRRGRQVLLALGAWSPMLAKQLRLRVPIQPGKGYSITYARPARVPRQPLVLRDRSVCVTSWGSGFRLGSTMEFSGYNSELNALRLAALERAAADFLHEVPPVGSGEAWQGWRPMTPDDLPLLGRAPRHANLWLACGHGMLGISMSAGSGRLLAELITGAAPFLDPSPYSPARF